MRERGPGALAARVLFVAALGASSVVGCATLHSKDALNELQESVEAYNEAFRWKNYERAAQYLPADTRGAYLATYDEESDPLHIDDYQIVDVKIENDVSAMVRVKLRYMMLPSVTIERAQLVQHWKRIQGTWTLESEEGSLREVVASRQPKKAPTAPEEVDPAAQGSSDVDVTNSKGEIIR